MSKAEEAGKLAQELMYAGNNIFSCAPQVIVRIAADCAALEARVKELEDKADHDRIQIEGLIAALDNEQLICRSKEAELERLKAHNKPVGKVKLERDVSTSRYIATVIMREDLVLADMKDGDDLYTQPRPAAAVPVKVCKWSWNECDYHWQSACGGTWVFNDGGPEENDVKFCQCCGGEVVNAGAEVKS